MLNWTREHFAAKGVDNPRLSAELLLADALGCKKIELYTRFEYAPTESQLATFRSHVQKAAAHAPIPYLIGRKEFFSLDLIVTPDVLIPRPETETLVECALAFSKTLPTDELHLLDLGTGSGAIAIAIAKYQGKARIVASDISEAALAIARQNIEKHGVADRVCTLQADGPALPAEAVPEGGFDVVVSNPPYIAEDLLSELSPNVREYEPRVALAAGDGLVMYRRLAAEGVGLLRPGGRCYVEIGLGQAAPVKDLFASAQGWKFVGVWPDLAGLDRVLGFERQA